MKNLFKIALAVLIVSTFAFTIQQNNDTDKIVAVIDVGHGGTDSGGNAGLYSEKEIVRQISEKIALLNTNENLEIHFTRAGDAMISLMDRVALINQLNPDVVFSLHVNQSKNKRNTGAEIFYSTLEPNEKSKNIAELAKKKIDESNLFSKSKIKNANFFILKNSKAPSILLQLGFLTNTKDIETLTNPDTQSEIAEAILATISEI